MPFTVNAPEGEKIYFYYTYSFPNMGEQNNSANKDSYVIGTCKGMVSVEQYFADDQLKAYPNPVTDWLQLELPEGENHVTLFSITGQKLAEQTVSARLHRMNFEAYPAGLYLVRVENDGQQKVIKVVK